MKKSILFFVSFMVFSMMAYSQGWNAATTGILYADPTSLKVGIGTSSPLSSTGMLLDIGGSTQVNGNIYPKLAITATDNSIQGMQLQNKSTGTSAEMRFIAAADDNSYMAFAQPSSTNTATTLFGVPKNSGSFIFNYANE